MKRLLSICLLLCLLPLPLAGEAADSASFSLVPEVIHPGASATIRYTLTDSAPVTLALQDQAGQAVYTLLQDQEKEAGEQVVRWDGRLEGGVNAPEGSYLLALATGGQVVATQNVQVGTPAPVLGDVLPSDDRIIPGEVVTLRFVASEAGTLRLTVYHDVQAPQGQAVGDFEVPAGEGQVEWDGTLSGAPVSGGEWRVGVRLTNAMGVSSIEHSFVLQIEGEEAAPTASAPVETQGGGNVLLTESGTTPVDLSQLVLPTEPALVITNYADETKNNYWQMDISNFDIYDKATQEQLWAYMMQPITVLDTDPTEHIYPVNAPGASTKESGNITGQLHGTTQGVNVVRQEGEWSLIEAYSNDGYRAPSKKIYDYAGKLIEGWVPTSKLKTVEPNQNIGLVIDKLYQKLYIFQNGELTGELLISTGKVTKNDPNTETPAGEFITDSWVGEFESYGMFCDLAIRINGGVLLHEVPHRNNADGSRRYGSFEPYLGQKASHGCVRVQRVRNEQGQNMQWLWDNLKRKAKVLIIDDVGRLLPPPDMDMVLYYNTTDGKNYHADQNCSGVKSRWLPLKGKITYADLYGDFDYLTPCQYCAPPAKYDFATAGMQQEVPDDVLGVGGESEADATETTQEVDPDTYVSEEYESD